VNDRRFGRPALALASLLLAASALPAQQVPPRLTVADALRLAREHNPVLRRAANDAGVAAWQVRQAWAAFLPSVTTSLGFGANRSTSLSGTDDFGQPVESPISRTFTSSSASQGISSSLLLFDGGANIRQLTARRAEARATDAMVEAQALSVGAAVERAWYQALRAQQNIALEEQLLASARDRLEQAEALLRLAANDQVDVLGARAEVATQQRNLEQARGEAQKSRLLLLQAIGLENAGDFELAGELPAVFDPTALAPDSLLAHALRGNPVVQQRALQASAARQRTAAARGSRLPQISLSGSYGRSMSAEGGAAFGRLDPPNSSASFGINVSLPLFRGLNTSVQVAQAEAAADDAAEELRAARLELATGVRNAHIDLVNTHRSLELSEQSAALSRERLELAQEKFRLGAFSFTELQNVIDRTAQAERGALDARFAFVAARIALEERIGSPLAR
jgi:outer membrane protein